MVNGSLYYSVLESVSNSISFIYRSYHLPMPDPIQSNADSLKLQLHTARKMTKYDIWPSKWLT